MYHFFLSGTFVVIDLTGIKNIEIMYLNPIIFLLIALVVTIILSYVSIAIGNLVRRSDFLGKIVYGNSLISEL